MTISVKFCMVCRLPDIITYAKFQVDLFRGYDFTGGRISHFPINFFHGLTTVQRDCAACGKTRNSSGDEIANVNFLCDDIVHTKNTIDSCINSATDRFLQRRFTNFSEITQCNGHYAVQSQQSSLEL